MSSDKKNSTLSDILQATKGIAKLGLAGAAGFVTYNYVPQLYEYIKTAQGSETIPDGALLLSCAVPAFVGVALAYTLADSGISTLYQSLKSKNNTPEKNTR